uniref:ATPase n=1 Tax=uncultured bacterium 35A20 TaxID=1194347 RepID=K7PES3_9BACT|nr:ATPase [uncultured bacterium 35A20]
MTLINRPEYLKQLKSWHGQTELVKIITGVRRCGKSMLLTLFQNHLLADGIKKEQIHAINFEDDENEKYTDRKVLHNHILDCLVPDKMNYVFLDEIQIVQDWQKAVNSLRLRPNIDIYLTGSNAYMFSGELATLLGGRYIEIKMQPLSFKEYVDGKNTINESKQAINLQEEYDHYIRESGFPQTLFMNGNRQMINDYLMNSVYLNTIQKDIIRRYKIKDTIRLENIIRYMFDNIGNETSLRGIEAGLRQDGRKATVKTIDIYLQGLLDSYLMYKCPRYDLKGKKLLHSECKYYAADMGLRTALLGRENTDLGYMLENVVYLELLRRGYNVTVGKVKKKTVKGEPPKIIEVDFAAVKPGGNPEYYQVSWTVMGNEETYKREIMSLEEIKDNYPKYLLTMDFGSAMHKGIKRVNVLDWLLGKE